jgi:hypothetical protein
MINDRRIGPKGEDAHYYKRSGHQPFCAKERLKDMGRRIRPFKAQTELAT